MSSNYQLAMKLNSIFRFPVLPEEIVCRMAVTTPTSRCMELVECTIIQGSAAVEH